jgi:hypothetical protein
MGSGFVPRRKNPRTLEHNIDIQVAPWKIFRIALSKNGDSIAAHDKRAILNGYRCTKATVGGVKLQKMCIDLRRAQVVNRNNTHARRNVWSLVQRTQDVSTDPTKPVNRYVDHATSPFQRGLCSKFTIIQRKIERFRILFGFITF